MNFRLIRMKNAGILLAAAALLGQTPSATAQSLDFGFFRSRVEPIFLKQRGDHARCYSCHEGANNGLNLQSLSPGRTFWTVEQSRENFRAISRIVVPGRPNASRFLLHPLAPEAGGDPGPTGMHPGGRQFETKDDPDWKTLAEWVSGGRGRRRGQGIFGRDVRSD